MNRNMADMDATLVADGALDAAKRQMRHAKQMDGEYAAPALQWVQAYAAIAQAEALERIANALESVTIQRVN